MRTAETIEQQHEQGRSSIQNKRNGRGRDRRQRKVHKNSLANLRPKPWPKGKSGNPGGRPHDVAAEIARNVIEENKAAIYNGLAERAIEGNAYTFKELAERGYGKLKEHVEHSGDDLLLAALALGRKRIASDDAGS